MGSVKKKLLITIIPVVVVMVVFLVLFSYKTSSRVIEAYSENLLETSVNDQAMQIKGWLDENLVVFQSVKTMIEKMQPTDDELQVILDTYYNYNSNYPEGLYIADEKGNLMVAKGASKTATDLTQSIWYKEGLSRVNLAFGSIYTNAEGESLISASGILNDGGQVLRVISADVSLDRVSIITNSFIEMKGAEAFLIDGKDNTILAHRDASKISTQLTPADTDRFLSKVAEKITNKDYSFCKLQGNMTSMKRVSGTDWILVSYIPVKTVLADLAKLRVQMVVTSIIAILALCILIERVAHMVIKPIKTLTANIIAMTQGDFTVEVDAVGNDEVGQMSGSVQVFIETMKNMICHIKDISSHLKMDAIESKGVASEMSKAAHTQSQSMNELNITVNQLTQSIIEIAEHATLLAGIVNDTKENSIGANEKMKQTVVASEIGRKDMKQLNHSMEVADTSIKQLEAAVNKVGDASYEIKGIIKLIGEIAEETNLLSLNAAIEAARAGEQGKGFAVVATEIGKLAQNSTNSVKRITSIIEQMNELVRDSVTRAGESVKCINESNEMIQRTESTIHNIFENIEETNHMVNDITNKVGKVDEIAMSLAAISEEQAASSEEIAATSENMVIHADNISENSKQVAREATSLEETANKLEDQVKIFKI